MKEITKPAKIKEIIIISLIGLVILGLIAFFLIMLQKYLPVGDSLQTFVFVMGLLIVLSFVPILVSTFLKLS